MMFFFKKSLYYVVCELVATAAGTTGLLTIASVNTLNLDRKIMTTANTFPVKAYYYNKAGASSTTY